MSKRAQISIITALVIVVGAGAPRAVHGSSVLNVTSVDAVKIVDAVGALDTTETADAEPQATQTETAQAETGQTEAEQPKKRRGNSLARVLSAPFRALARIFGGGDKSEKTAAKSTEKQARGAGEQAQATTNTPAPQDAQSATSNAAPNVERDSGATQALGAPRVETSAAATTPDESFKIVRPGEMRPPQGLWIPVIEGIPRDALSQGRALLQHGYVNEAISELTVAASVGPNLVEANNLLGLAYDRIGWHKLAVECYERALSVAPSDPVILSNLGYSLYLDDNYNAALKRLKQAARRAPQMQVIHNNLGVVQARAGKFDDAFKSFVRAGGEYDAHLKLAEILTDIKRDREAIKHYEAALRIQPDSSAVLEHLVALYERTGRRQEAETARRTLGQPRNPQKTATGGGGD